MPTPSPHCPSFPPSTFAPAESLLSAIVASSDDAIISKDLNGIVTSWNEGAARIFGYSPEEIMGKSVLVLIPDELKGEETGILARLRSGQRIDHFETIRLHKSGRRLNISLTVSPVRDTSGVIVGASKVARDITEKKASEAALEEQSRMKDEFLATLSHELRTPLQSILGWAQVLQQDMPSPDELKEGLDVIYRNAEAQTRIIEDLLDMNRILSGKVRLEVQRVSLADVLEESIETVKPAADAKQIRLEVIVDRYAGPISGDSDRLRQVFWNLLSNAIKFTPRNGRIQAVLERSNSHVEISIADNGAGISPEFLPFVFDRFRQADPSMTRKHGGLGLGLAIAKHLTELHGGRISVKSPGIGQGATFTLSIPVAPVETEPDANWRRPVRPDTPAEPPPPSLHGISVLVVDDEPDSRRLLRRILADSGAVVHLADSAAEALRLIAQAPPNVVISDIGMPDRDGFSLIREIRALTGPEKSIPAIALTAYTRAEDRMRAIASGFQMHLAKPANTRELVVMVKALSKPLN